MRLNCVIVKNIKAKGYVKPTVPATYLQISCLGFLWAESWIISWTLVVGSCLGHGYWIFCVGQLLLYLTDIPSERVCSAFKACVPYAINNCHGAKWANNRSCLLCVFCWNYWAYDQCSTTLPHVQYLLLTGKLWKLSPRLSWVTLEKIAKENKFINF